MHDVKLYAKVWDIIGTSLSGIYPTYSGRVYYQAAPMATDFPVLVYQPVVNKAYSHHMLNDSYWSAWITLRSVDSDFQNAQNLLAQSLENLSTIQYITVSGLPTTYSVRYDIRETPSFPIEKLSEAYFYTAAVTLEVTIFPNDY